MSDRDHFVYTALDADGIALYVGCTGNPEMRYRAHRTGNANARGWFDHFVTHWHVSGPYPKRVALDIEKARIQALQPIFNGVSLQNANSPDRRGLVNAYMRFHRVKFVPHPTAMNKASIVPTGGRRLRARRAAA